MRHGGILNSHRVTSPLVRLAEGEERWETPDCPQGFLPLWNKESHHTCNLFYVTANDRPTSHPLRDEFHGTRSD
ncbi:hypothetical protein TNCV_3422511 [Trichonephila clavipes]|nr:hypothetical protein TNCV_3422511 [Trichonephila clavipes]